MSITYERVFIGRLGRLNGQILISQSSKWGEKHDRFAKNVWILADSALQNIILGVFCKIIEAL